MNRIALLTCAAVGIAVVSLAAGVMIGRQFPAHRFERFGTSRYVMDVSTGKVCDPFPGPTVTAAASKPETPSIFDQFYPKDAQPPHCGN